MSSQRWKLILDGPNSGAYNMAVDESLLNEASASPPSNLTYLRFFQWARPTLSLGFSQKAERVIDLDFCRKNGIECVRRTTGGKAVLHHKELTYSIVSNNARLFPMEDIGETYRRIALALVLGFRRLGVEACLAGEDRVRGLGQRSRATSACFAVSNHHEILWDGRKLVGSAQRRTKTAFLQHGSIMLEFDPEFLAGALGHRNPTEFRSKVTSLADCLGRTPTPSEVIRSLQQGFRDSFNIDFERTSLNSEQRQSVEELVGIKYALLDWSNPSVTRSSRAFDSEPHGLQ